MCVNIYCLKPLTVLNRSHHLRYGDPQKRLSTLTKEWTQQARLGKHADVERTEISLSTSCCRIIGIVAMAQLFRINDMAHR